VTASQSLPHTLAPVPSKTASAKPTPTPKPTPPKPIPQPKLLGTFTSTYPAAAYRTHNVGRAAQLINGSTVNAGETWSLNKTVGERTKANGFVEGTIIGASGNYEESYGGGVSTVATTLYNTTLLSGLDVIERGAHSFYIDRYLEGRDATVAWGTLDYKFRNDSSGKLTIRASSTPTSVTVSFYGTPKYDNVKLVTGPRTAITQPKVVDGDPDNCVEQTAYVGFDVNVTRKLYKAGSLVLADTFPTHYVPRNAVTCPAEGS
jgi:vancomycin resistance protein YoaR